MITQQNIPPIPTMMTQQTVPGILPSRTLAMKQQTNRLEILERPVGSWGVAQQQQRASEDRYQAKQIGPFRYFAVFDGHGGTRKMGPMHVADYCVEHLHEKLATEFGGIDINNQQMVLDTIVRAFIEFDREMHDLGKIYGTTCTVVLIDDQRNKIYQVNLGDSRSIIFNNAEIISATDDHDANLPREEDRINNAGGYVMFGRVNGMLMVARAFGDFELKTNKDEQYDPINGKVIAVPDIKITQIQKPMYILLTSDAPYERDVFSDESLIDLFRTKNAAVAVTEPNRLNIIARNMVNDIYPKTTDDTTIVLVEV
jgi:protein phosphatase 1B